MELFDIIENAKYILKVNKYHTDETNKRIEISIFFFTRRVKKCKYFIVYQLYQYIIKLRRHI